jgi:uncharacterized protein YlxW (UPF0749 family)
MSEELAGIHDRLVAIESALGVGTARRRRFRFSLRALFWLLALAAVISFTTVEHWKAALLKAENAKLKAENATLQAKTSALTRNMQAVTEAYDETQRELTQRPKSSSPFILP